MLTRTSFCKMTRLSDDRNGAADRASRRRGRLRSSACFGVLLLALGAAAADDDALRSASRLLAAGNATQAVEQLRAFVAANPQSADGHRLLGIAYALSPQRTLALETLRRAVELAPGDPRNRLSFAQALARFGENGQAREQYAQALAIDGSLAAAHEGLALLLAMDGDLESAAAGFSQALKLVSAPADRARLLYLLGKAQSQLGRTEQATASLREATELAPAFGQAYLELARLLAERQEPEGAEHVFVRAAELLPESAEAHRLLGQFHLRARRAESAIAPLREAIEIDPNDRAAALALGRALRASGQVEEARRLMAALAAKNEDRALTDAEIAAAGALNNEGVEFEKEQRYEEALDKYREAIAMAPADVRFRRNAGLVLSRLGRWEEAKVELREVLRLEPGDSTATQALYTVLERAPDPQ